MAKVLYTGKDHEPVSANDTDGAQVLIINALACILSFSVSQKLTDSVMYYIFLTVLMIVAKDSNNCKSYCKIT